MEIKSSKAASVNEAKEILSNRKEDGELGYEQSQALEHAQRFSKNEPAKAQKLVQNLVKKGKLTEEAAIKIVDIHPNNAATVKAILLKDRIEVTEEEAEEIVKEIS